MDFVFQTCYVNFDRIIIQCLHVYLHHFCHVYFCSEQCCLVFLQHRSFSVVISKTLRLRTYTKQIRNNVWHRQNNFRYCQKIVHVVWLIIYCLPSRWRVFDWAFPIAAVTRDLGLYGLIRRPAPYSAWMLIIYVWTCICIMYMYYVYTCTCMCM